MLAKYVWKIIFIKKLVSCKEYLSIVHSVNVPRSIVDILWKHFLLVLLLLYQNIENYIYEINVAM